MIESAVLSWVLTGLFAGTAGYGVLRCARLWSSGRPGTDEKSVELAHLLMNVAMVGMVWMWGGPGTQVAQLVVFGAFSALFLLRAWSSSTALGRGAARVFGYHALMAGSMTWMVAAMSTMTGHGWAADNAGHHDVPATADAAAASGPAVHAPVWTVVVTIVLVAGLAAATVAWAGAARAAGFVRPAVPVAAGAVGTAGRATVGSTETSGVWTSTVPSTEAGPLAAVLGAGPAAVCHALMSAGMAAMLLAMV